METIPVLVALALLLFLLLSGVPVAFSLASTGIVGLVLISGGDIVGSVIAGTTYTAVGKSNLVVVPMFILMGMLTLNSGIAEQLFAVAAKVLKKLPGGLAVATIFASAGFGAVSGSSLASVGTIGKLAISEMVRHGYNRSFAAASVAVSGSLAVLIPPSIILVLYGAVTGESVGNLLLAGIIPGVLSALMLGGFSLYRAWRKPALIDGSDMRRRQELAIAKGQTFEVEEAATVKISPASVTGALIAIGLIFLVVMGGIYSGVFTPSESAAVGAVVALLLLVGQYIKKPRVMFRNLGKAFTETVSLNAMIFMILVGAGIFSYFLVVAGVPTALSQLVVGLPVPPELTVIFLLLILIPGGMFLDSISLLVITVPLVYQPIMDLGFNGIWLGILIVKLIELGMITPPIGMNVFVTAGTTRGLGVHEVFKGVIPFYIADVAIIAVLFAFPSIVTWLPDLSMAAGG
ncbi:TRAP transporter large permease [Leucobacter denitrificans]